MTNTKPSRSPAVYALYALMILLAFIFLLPFLFMVTASFKSQDQIFSDLESVRAFLPVGDLSLNNYEKVVSGSGIGRFLWNSTLITVTTVGMGLIVNSLAAFSLARLQWRGKGFILAILVALLIIPLEAIAVPMMLIVAELPGLAFGSNGIEVRGSCLIPIMCRYSPLWRTPSLFFCSTNSLRPFHATLTRLPILTGLLRFRSTGTSLFRCLFRSLRPSRSCRRWRCGTSISGP